MSFDYSGIPVGFYDQVLTSGSAIRRAWHLQKFLRVVSLLRAQSPDQPQSILDIGCFAGSFLSLLPQADFPRQVGVDILPDQIAYASHRYGQDFREFRSVKKLDELQSWTETFDAISLIEVIEHLSADEIKVLLQAISSRLRPGGVLVFSTPNYLSAWPLIELILNRVSEVSYHEQHLTKFNYITIERRLTEIYPKISEDFQLLVKTTTHFMSPFLAPLVGVERSCRLSDLIGHQHWKLPVGNLLLMALRRR